MSVIEAIKAGDEARASELAAQDPGAGRQRDEQGIPATLLALYYGRTELANRLRPADSELDVFEAASFGRVERLRELLDEDPGRANAWAPDGFQPLGLAAFFGQLDAARLLLDRGADPNSLARNERIKAAPIHSAAAVQDDDTRHRLVELMLDHGGDPNLRQGDGFSPLDAAKQHGDERLAKLLRERGAVS